VAPQEEERERGERPERDGGTLPPAFRASESPIAIACFRLLTVLPERPDFSFPRFISCRARSTFREAFFPYLLGMGLYL